MISTSFLFWLLHKINRGEWKFEVGNVQFANYTDTYGICSKLHSSKIGMKHLYELFRPNSVM